MILRLEIILCQLTVILERVFLVAVEQVDVSQNPIVRHKPQ